MGKPQQKFGGDDDSSGSQLPPEQPKKLDLKKYASKPDANIRDVFWDIMANYATKKQLTKEELQPFENERHALIRIALSVIENPESAYYGISKNFVAKYTLMMTIDAEWDDVFDEFIIRSYDEGKKPDKSVIMALNKIYESENYRNYILESFKLMIKEHSTLEAIIAYIRGMKNRELTKHLKKELLIVAKGDVETNQYNAMIAIAEIKDEDEECRSALTSLLMHWDDETRRMAATLLKGDNDPKVAEMAKRQLALETNEEVKKLLMRLIKNANTKKEDKQEKDKDGSNKDT